MKVLHKTSEGGIGKVFVFTVEVGAKGFVAKRVRWYMATPYAEFDAWETHTSLCSALSRVKCGANDGVKPLSDAWSIYPVSSYFPTYLILKHV